MGILCEVIEVLSLKRDIEPVEVESEAQNSGGLDAAVEVADTEECITSEIAIVHDKSGTAVKIELRDSGCKVDTGQQVRIQTLVVLADREEITERNVAHGISGIRNRTDIELDVPAEQAVGDDILETKLEASLCIIIKRSADVVQSDTAHEGKRECEGLSGCCDCLCGDLCGSSGLLDDGSLLHHCGNLFNDRSLSHDRLLDRNCDISSGDLFDNNRLLHHCGLRDCCLRCRARAL